MLHFTAYLVQHKSLICLFVAISNTNKRSSMFPRMEGGVFQSQWVQQGFTWLQCCEFDLREISLMQLNVLINAPGSLMWQDVAFYIFTVFIFQFFEFLLFLSVFYINVPYVALLVQTFSFLKNIFYTFYLQVLCFWCVGILYVFYVCVFVYVFRL